MASKTPVVLTNGQFELLQAGDSLTVVTQSPLDNSTKVATTAYVDNAVTVIDAKDPVSYCSTSALPANTYNNGTLGVGATLTASSNGFLVIDGVTVAIGYTGLRVLIAAEAAPANNGWYIITNPGSVITKYVLTRDTASDQSAEIESGYITAVNAPSGLTAGSSNNAKAFISSASSPFTVGADSLTFSLMGANFLAGNGLTLTAVTFSIDTSITVDKTTAQTLTNKTLTTPIINGLPTGTGVASAPTVSTLVSRDSNGNISAVNIIEGYTTTVTSAGTLTLTAASNGQQFFTGATTHILKLPVTTTLVLGVGYIVVNNSSGTIAVQSNGGGAILTLAANTEIMIWVINASSDGASSWAYNYTGFNSITGTGSVVLSASPALTGDPQAPTPTVGDNDTSISTTAFVVTAINNNIGKIISLSRGNYKL